jgi:hypothetical protein
MAKSPVPHFALYQQDCEAELFRAVSALASDIENQPSTLARFQEFEAKKLHHLEVLREEHRAVELSTLQDRPCVNPRSAKLQREPLHQRIHAELRKKDEKLYQLKQALLTERARKEQAECTFTPKILKTCHTPTADFATRSQVWLERRRQATARKQESLAQEEAAACPAQPHINPSPNRLARNCRTPEPNRPALCTENRPLPIPRKKEPINELRFHAALEFAVANLLRT